MKNNNNIFDRVLKERLSKEELSFDPMAWEMMEEKLDEKKKRFFFWKFPKLYFLGGTAFFILLTIIYWPFHYNTSLEKSISEVESTKENQAKEINVTRAKEPEVVESASDLFAEGLDNRIDKDYSKNISILPNRNSQNIDISDASSSSHKQGEYISLSDFSKAKIFDQPKGLDPFGQNQTSFINTSFSSNIDRIKKEENKVGLIQSLDPIFMNTRFIDSNRLIDVDFSIIDIEEKIERPKHNIHIALGGGMTKIKIDEPYIGDVKPVAIANQEVFFSLSYLYRAHRNFGFELGALAAFKNQKIAHYFQAGDYNLSSPQYGTVNVNAYEGKYEIFANAHFFLPLDQRSELDFYAGYYARNLFEGEGAWGGGHGIRLPENNDVTLMRSYVSGNSGPFEGGRLKLGVNYNFLTNKLNTVGIGISYMHELINDVEGRYTMFETNDNAKIAGNLRANGSGVKVQFNYGFGLDTRPWEVRRFKQKTSNGLKNPWYFGFRWGTKRYFLDGLSRLLIGPNVRQQYSSFFLGHYIKKKLALEFGLEHSRFVFQAPTDYFQLENYTRTQQNFISVPVALRYDLFQTSRLSFYSKGVLSTDFRLNPSNNGLIPNSRMTTSFVTDKNKFLLNAGIETGIDIKLFKGVNLGVLGKYNHAFSSLYQYQYAISFSENVYEFQDITLTNRYFSWGVELKYMFNK